MLTWQFFDEWFLRLLNANHFVGGCSLFIYSIATGFFVFNIRIAFLKIEMHQRGGAGAFHGKGNTIMGRMIMCQMAIHLTVMIIVDACVRMMGFR